MGQEHVIWCDGCQERQFGGSPSFEVRIEHRQILPRRDHQATQRQIVLCGFQCYDKFMQDLEKFLASRVKAKAPTVALNFADGRKKP